MSSPVKFSFSVILASAVLLTGCGKATPSAATDSSTVSASPSSAVTASASPAPAEGKKLKVVASFYPMYEFARQVGGDYAEVTALIGGGVEPHDWEPTPKDVAAIQEADLFVYNGIVEGWADKVITSAASDKRVDVKASEGITLAEGEDEHDHDHEGEAGHEEDNHDSTGEGSHEEEEHGLDPHVWLSPVLAQKEVQTIAEAYKKADPAHKDEYQKNADAYIAKLKELDEAFKTDLQNVLRKDFITQHAAFAYLAKEYGLTQVPIAGLSPEQEPSPEQMAEVITFAQDHQVKTIFFETLVEPKIAETIAKEIGAKTDVLNPLEGLTDEERQKGLDYIGIMKNNLEALKKALSE
ncbi:metal ABC transporter substrate-binding protein [Gorillibacterium timonense]|uniref:metal ABC transporter substrate-binding protein n=1 Tax=Gorillibacterium timonense TaxID=1689269 RepID=UPI00071DB516